ncbi:response regulator transcription factor [Photobacterium sp. TY1-4]|uniref:response regulator transcription factor n=1 Tax=Photobacterium sp. TY1-4 TaxID=2899122 RepID=UPI0021BE45E0|nr:response regulator [Photobacterium sp. TY1-4]UXI03650.1 response regulator [Photobacterium sp. TY1-4]
MERVYSGQEPFHNQPQLQRQQRKALSVYVVDDDASVRDSLAFMLEGYGFTVRTYADGPLFLAQVDLQQPGCVILDSRMPIMCGQQVHQYLSEHHSPLAVIYLTGHGDVPMAVDALQAGAVHFFQKPVKAQALADAIEQGFQASAATMAQLQSRAAFQSLTQREKEILRLIIAGKRNQQVADTLCIAVRTVEVHRASLMKKFAAKTVAELAYFYGRVAEA